MKRCGRAALDDLVMCSEEEWVDSNWGNEKR